MTSELKLLATVGVIALLAGCGGGSDGGSDGPGDSGGDPPTFDTFSEIEAEATAMAANYLDPDTGLPTVETTEATEVLAAGSGTYNGFVGGDITGGDLGERALVGELELQVAFTGSAPGTVTGSASNFFDSSDNAYTGVLNVDPLFSGALIPGDDYQLSVFITGLLNDGDIDYSAGIFLDGDFLGAQPGAVGGFADGGVGGGFFSGGFIAER